MDEDRKRTPSRGRPRSAEPGGTVCTWLPSSAHDRLIRLAKARDASVSTVVREILDARLKKRTGENSY